MATIAIGDVHGNIAALDDLLRQVKGVVSDEDVVVFLGDYIDRGPSSRECIDAILAFEHEIEAEVVCLCGNHEDWLLRTMRDYRRHSWLLGMEGFDTIRSYSVDAEQALRDAASNAGYGLFLERCALPYEAFFGCMPDDHLRFFRSLRPFYKGEDCLCTHGGLDPLVSRLEDQVRDALIWGTGDFPRRYTGEETVMYGHWNNAVLTPDGWPTPRIVGRTIGLDTIAHGVLTAVRYPDRRVFQSARYVVCASDG